MSVMRAFRSSGFSFSPANQARPGTVIIDDENIFAETLEIWLEKVANLKVLGTASSADSGWELCQSLHPDLVLLDVGLPEGSGFDVVRRLKSQPGHTRIIILTGRVDPHTAWRATQENVHGVVDKTSGLESLREAISVVMAGGHFVCPVFQRIRARLVAESAAFYKILSDREMEVLSRITTGQSDDEIAKILGVSKLTIVCHRRNIRQKLELHDDRSLMIFGRRCGVFETLPPAA